jgi:Na+/H+ antiporter NhaD/arsenite permease-like protein
MAVLIVLFLFGYLLIVFENSLRINKAAIALVTGAICWTVLSALGNAEEISEHLSHYLSDISSILFFLLGAMTIVEIVDAHDGFDVITNRIVHTNKRRLLMIITVMSFLLSAALDNLTTTIVMVSLIRKILYDKEDRLRFCGMIVVAANAGGAWSPIGDVTTTMLWIKGNISPWPVIVHTIIPCVISTLIPFAILAFGMKGNAQRPAPSDHKKPLSPFQQGIILFSGILVLICVPVFKSLTHLPPYMGVLFGLGILWILTEILHGKKKEEDRNFLSVVYALRKIDSPSILFFFGILAAVAALQEAGALRSLSGWLSAAVENQTQLVGLLGIISSIIDNVPLVAAVQGMYPSSLYPMDHTFWHFLAYATGTGGSLLIIGSAAGVAAMGMERISFRWYLKRITLPALAGYIAGAAVYVAFH